MKAAALLAAALVLGAAIRALVGWLMGEPQPARDGALYSTSVPEHDPWPALCVPDRTEWTEPHPEPSVVSRALCEGES